VHCKKVTTPPGLGFRFHGLGFRVWGLMFRVWGLEVSASCRSVPPLSTTTPPGVWFMVQGFPRGEARGEKGCNPSWSMVHGSWFPERRSERPLAGCSELAERPAVVHHYPSPCRGGGQVLINYQTRARGRGETRREVYIVKRTAVERWSG
jgi:hypothetical protein